MTKNSKSDLITHWMDELKADSLSVQLNYIDIIVDQAGTDEPIIPVLKTIDNQLQWFSFYTGLPEEHYIDQAPLLIRIEWDKPKQQILLKEILNLFIFTPRILTLSSYCKFNKLSQYLQRLSEASCGNQTCLFRFYDSRIFPALMKNILTQEQRDYFNKIARIWGWMDRDHKLNRLVGEHNLDLVNSIKPNIVLTDEQINQLGCISDATLFISDNLSVSDGMKAEDVFSSIYALAIETNKSDYLGSFENYIAQHYPQLLNKPPTYSKNRS